MSKLRVHPVLGISRVSELLALPMQTNPTNDVLRGVCVVCCMESREWRSARARALAAHSDNPLFKAKYKHKYD